MILLFLICAFLLLIFFVVALWWLKRKASRSGLGLVGRVASVERELNPEGHVFIDGELWPARTPSGRRVGRGPAKVRVVAARGHLLEVEPLERDVP